MGLWLVVSYVEYDVCLPGQLSRLGITGQYADLVTYTDHLLLPGMTPNEVESALMTVGSVRVTSQQSYMGETFRTYRVSMCWTPLTSFDIGTAFDRDGRLVGANPYGVD